MPEKISLAKPKRWTILGLVGLFIIITIFKTVMIVSPGNAAIAVMFGTMQPGVYESGVNVVPPVANFVTYPTRRVTVGFEAGGTEGENKDDLLAQSSDRTPLTIDVTFAFRFTPRFLPWVYENVGGPQTALDTLLTPAARTAVRPATARFTMNEAIGAQGRVALAQAMQEECNREVQTSLTSLGLSREQAGQAIVCLPVLLRRVEPPEAVQQAQAERQGAQIGVETAALVTQREVQLAQAQTARGQGLANLQAGAPSGWVPSQIAEVIRAQATQTNALANQQHAAALQAAVDGGRVSVIYMDGGGSVAAQGPQQTNR